ncbi:MAG: hypothetical protein FD130_1989 [Halothiobacillaceae bacterium]|nr:MAG: hypothetical protein FD130_1989 [Halothiobacillaceae bacterium]
MELIIPAWPAPSHVKACTTTRHGGVSGGVYRSLNLGDHVGDLPHAVAENRQRLHCHLQLPNAPRWLSQIHGVAVVAAHDVVEGMLADGSYSDRSHEVCVVLTADCLPVLLCSRDGLKIAAVHAGWRGLVDGVILQAVSSLRHDPADIMAWLGPAIGPTAFEVGEEVRERFMARDWGCANAFIAHETGRWWADLYLLARQQLAQIGVTAVYGGDLCTYCDPERFFSYRRDQTTGRMATLIWREA